MAGPFYMQGGALPALNGVPTLITQAEYEACCCEPPTYCRIRVNYYCVTTPSYPYYYTVKPKEHCSPAGISGVANKGSIWVDKGRYVITHTGSIDKAWSTDLSHTNCGGGPCWSTRHWIEWDAGPEGYSSIRSFEHFTQPAVEQTSAYDAVSYASAYKSTHIEVNKRTQLFFWVNSKACANNVGEVTMRLGTSAYKHWRWTTYRQSPPLLPYPVNGSLEQSCTQYYQLLGYHHGPILPPSPMPEYVTCPTSGNFYRRNHYDTVDEIGVEGWETIQ